MDEIDLPVGALVEHRDVLMRHVGGGRFVRHVPEPHFALPPEGQMAKRFSADDDGPIAGRVRCSS